MNETILNLAFGAVMVIGLFGTLIPVVPGPSLIWIAAVVYGAVSGFDPTAWITLTVITVGLLSAFYFGIRIPQRSGAGLDLRYQILAFALAVVGIFVIPGLGAPIGFALGIWLGHWHTTNDVATANQATMRTVKALVKASAAQFACALGMVLAWTVWAFA